MKVDGPDYVREDKCGCKVWLQGQRIRIKDCEKHTWQIEDW